MFAHYKLNSNVQNVQSGCLGKSVETAKIPIQVGLFEMCVPQMYSVKFQSLCPHTTLVKNYRAY